jgi:hypothetical protein
VEHWPDDAPARSSTVQEIQTLLALFLGIKYCQGHLGSFPEEKLPTTLQKLQPEPVSLPRVREKRLRLRKLIDGRALTGPEECPMRLDVINKAEPLLTLLNVKESFG